MPLLFGSSFAYATCQCERMVGYQDAFKRIRDEKGDDTPLG
jgi:hypothetical protein